MPKRSAFFRRADGRISFFFKSDGRVIFRGRRAKIKTMPPPNAVKVGILCQKNREKSVSGHDKS